jgi:hypothetical protein
VATDAFHLVLPSLPGYGFSGWDPDRTARAWAELMRLPAEPAARLAAGALRMCWENVRSILAAFASGQPPAAVSLPVAYTVFPDELIQAPRSWAEKVYPHLVYFNEVDRGATSPPGKSRSCSPTSCGRRSDHCVSEGGMVMAVQQAPGLWRTDLQRQDLSVPGREAVQARVDIGPEAPLVKHTIRAK